MAKEKLKSYLTGISHTIGKEMAGSSHTPACCLSKLRSSLEAGKKQFRVWLQYGGSVTGGLLYPSFCAPFVFLRSSFDEWEEARFIYGKHTEVSRWCHGGLKDVYDDLYKYLRN